MDVTRIAQLAATQRGLVTFDQLRDLGVTERQVDRRVQSGSLERVHLGVFRVGGAPTTYEQRLLAACLAAAPDAAVSHRAAAVVYGLLSFREAPQEVTTSRLRSPEVGGAAVHRLADFSERWVRHLDGLRVTSPARTLVDLGAVCRPRLVETVLDRAAGRRLVTYREVRDAMVAVARKGRRGVGTMRSLLEGRIGEGVPSGVFEARMMSLLRAAALPAAVPEFIVRDDHDGFVAVVDFAFPELRIALEVDGYEFHSSPAAINDRNARDRLLSAIGWVALHYSWTEVEQHAQRVESEIRRHVRLRSASSAR